MKTYNSLKIYKKEIEIEKFHSVYLYFLLWYLISSEH